MSKFRYKVELNTIDDVKKFTDSVAQVKDCDVRLIGKDENGANWDISAKSLFCSLMMSQRLQTERPHTAHEVDWNTTWCECEREIYNLIMDFVR